LTPQSPSDPGDPSPLDPSGKEPPFDRLDELLASDLAGMLDDSERAELESLLATREDSAAVERSFAETAARFTLGSGQPTMALDRALRERLLESAWSNLPAAEQSTGKMKSEAVATIPLPLRPQAMQSNRNSFSPFRSLVAFGGYALAACLVVVVLMQNRAGTGEADFSSARVQLLNRDGVSPLPWKATDEDSRATGDVVWSPVRQSGYMRFANFTPNDPAKSQYQLWIFDRDRPEATPVDGGVFDVPADKPEVIVPIRPALPVSKAILFAVTEEPPGGVVVSDRKRLHLVAPVP
jgi:hypothetical protein